MSTSIILTNCFFFSLGAFLVVYLLDKPALLIYKNGIPIFAITALLCIRLLLPYEFTFTKTIASKVILPFIHNMEMMTVAHGLTLKSLFLIIWLSISVLLLITLAYKHRRCIRVVSMLPTVENKAMYDLLYANIKKSGKTNTIPRIVEVENCFSPTIIGIKNPTIIIPSGLSDEELKYPLLHEIEHYNHNHLIVKILSEIIFACYWWNPLVWLLRMYMIQALELQADAFATENLSTEEIVQYSIALIKMARNTNKTDAKKVSTSFSLTFATTKKMMKNRAHNLTDKIYNKVYKVYPVKQGVVFILSLLVILFSCAFTFEAYRESPNKTQGTEIVNPNKTYLLELEDGSYEVHINNSQHFVVKNIPDDFSHFPIYKK